MLPTASPWAGGFVVGGGDEGDDGLSLPPQPLVIVIRGKPRSANAAPAEIARRFGSNDWVMSASIERHHVVVRVRVRRGL
jgi:hypothetical protein